MDSYSTDSVCNMPSATVSGTDPTLDLSARSILDDDAILSLYSSSTLALGDSWSLATLLAREPNSTSRTTRQARSTTKSRVHRMVSVLRATLTILLGLCLLQPLQQSPCPLSASRTPTIQSLLWGTLDSPLHLQRPWVRIPRSPFWLDRLRQQM